MNFHVDPEQGHDAPLISLAPVTKASTDFSPGAAKVGLPDDSSHHLHTPICFPKKTSITEPHRIYGRA